MNKKIPLIFSTIVLLLSVFNFIGVITISNKVTSFITSGKESEYSIDLAGKGSRETTSSEFDEFLKDAGIEVAGQYKNDYQSTFLIGNEHQDILEQYSSWKEMKYSVKN